MTVVDTESVKKAINKLKTQATNVNSIIEIMSTWIFMIWLLICAGVFVLIFIAFIFMAILAAICFILIGLVLAIPCYFLDLMRN